MGRRVETVLGRVVVGAAFVMLAGCDSQMPISFNEPGSSPGASTSNAAFCAGDGGAVTATGGTLDCLSFAIVGDTRPPSIDDTAQYPSAIIGKIWQDVEAESPRPAFAITTGDYVFARATGAQANPQLDLYLQAQAAFSNPTFHALGNHECTGATTSNCGTGNANGVTKNYSAYLAKFLHPMGFTKPYYSVNMQGPNGAWTAKLVVIAGNAWDSTQAAWLDQVMAQPTTYTFVVRHEPKEASTAPGVTPSTAILANYPYTMLIVGHTHTYKHTSGSKEVVVGIGGAPLTSGGNYGYVVARQRVDGAMQFFVYDYETRAVVHTFAVDATGHDVSTSAGTPTPTATPTGTATPTPSGSDLITNGDFETSLSGWTLGGVKEPIDSSAQSHGGARALRCGATSGNGQTEPNGDSWASQTIDVPSSATGLALHFWYFAESSDTTNDWQEAEIRSSSGAVLATIFHIESDDRAWTEKTFDLSAYHGKTIEIRFNVHGNGQTSPTTMWIDDVSVVAP